ncbi:eCIS core domain-containing protein [Seohaeicola zhoushanensis]|uniref:eCIS core domain-containing protein n=1 Tax=Seohaeicola zhoushanensis TaxID=1569283 RepID=A0A8J3M8Q1_9RHOB|nr:DUF4157 domain-containing protein [Seohaeicola zhoushanensis]GHF43620.1 hypothetical protein GCM10017056_14400 [Seohaeicola zhoushanensis]
MSKDDVIQLAQSKEGKKARMKKLETEPAGTREKKLPKEVKDGLEEHFGVKLSKVRVHTGGNIKDICRELKTKAFVIDQNLYFSKTSDAKNTEMLTNQLTQVIQLFNDKLKKKTKDGRAIIAKK